MTPEQISAANKANMETLANLSRKAFEGVEKLMELNIQVAKTMMSEQVEHMKSCASAKDAQDLMAMQAKFVKPFSEKNLGGQFYSSEKFLIFLSIYFIIKNYIFLYSLILQNLSNKL